MGSRQRMRRLRGRALLSLVDKATARLRVLEAERKQVALKLAGLLAQYPKL